MAVMIPDDITREILLLVPVKSLIHFRCVSKTWCALIDCKGFVKRHLSNSIITKKNHKLIIADCGPGSHIRTAYLYSLGQTLDIEHPIDSSMWPLSEVIGSCNGLLCLHYDFDNYNFCRTIIWNPATRKHLTLSNPINKNNHSLKVIGLGFGYDSLSDDYKVVMLVHLVQFSFRTEAHVYSTRSNWWGKPIILAGCKIYKRRKTGVLACGALHWLMSSVFSWDACLINAFDLVTEKFKIVPLPNFHDNKVSVLRAAELGGCLSIVSCYRPDNGVFDVWVMKEYGVRKSWTKLFTFSAFKSMRFDNNSVITLAFSESGDEVLMTINYEQLLWYNLEKRTLKFVDGFGLSNSSRTLICLESLISLGGQAENDYIPLLRRG